MRPLLKHLVSLLTHLAVFRSMLLSGWSGVLSSQERVTVAMPMLAD